MPWGRASELAFAAAEGCCCGCCNDDVGSLKDSAPPGVEDGGGTAKASLPPALGIVPAPVAAAAEEATALAPASSPPITDGRVEARSRPAEVEAVAAPLCMLAGSTKPLSAGEVVVTGTVPQLRPAPGVPLLFWLLVPNDKPPSLLATADALGAEKFNAPVWLTGRAGPLLAPAAASARVPVKGC